MMSKTRTTTRAQRRPDSSTPPKVDLRSTFPHVYKAKRGKPELVDVPPISYLMLDGTGGPDTSAAYMDAIKALYATAYGTKFALKAQGKDFSVMPLESLWWSDSESFDLEDKSSWHWTAMIAVPDSVTPELVSEIVERAYQKAPQDSLRAPRFERFEEGPSAQVLYVGPYASEGPTIVALHGFITASGMRPRGKHHEIYFSDPRRTAPEKLRTIIRQPCEPDRR